MAYGSRPVKWTKYWFPQLPTTQEGPTTQIITRVKTNREKEVNIKIDFHDNSFITTLSTIFTRPAVGFRIPSEQNNRPLMNWLISRLPDALESKCPLARVLLWKSAMLKSHKNLWSFRMKLRSWKKAWRAREARTRTQTVRPLHWCVFKWHFVTTLQLWAWVRNSLRYPSSLRYSPWSVDACSKATADECSILIGRLINHTSSLPGRWVGTCEYVREGGDIM